MSAIIVLVAVMLAPVAAAQRLWPGLFFFGLLMVAQTAGSSVLLQAKPRLLVPAVTLLVPVAVALARTRLLVRVLALTPIVLFGLWFGAYSLSGSTAYSPADPGPRVPYRRSPSRRWMGAERLRSLVGL